MKLSIVQKLQLGVIHTAIGAFVLLEEPVLVPKLVFRVTLRLVLILSIIYFALTINVYKKNIDYLANYVFYVPAQVKALKPKSIVPRQVTANAFPDVSALGILVADLKSDTILYDRNKSEKYPPASTTKIMTALVADDLYDSESIFTVDYSCTQVPSQKIGLVSGEVLRFEDLLKAMLITSAGDAACTLAQDHSPVSFVARMNLYAKSLGMTDTIFSNAVGLDDYEHGQESTPYDLYLLTKQALKNAFIAQTVSIKELDIASLETATSSSIPHRLVNTNRLLWEIPESRGLKTGRTDGAKEVLIYVYAKDNIELAIIVMQSENRFEDTKKILEWVLSSYVWK